MTQPARSGTDIDKDNWVAVFYVDVSLEMSLSGSCTRREDAHA